MPRSATLAVISDIHYFATGEQARGGNYETDVLANPVARFLLKMYRHHFWLRHPIEHNYQLEKFLQRIGPVDKVVANGDYSCDSGFVGVSDGPACESAKECLGRLRDRFGDGFHATIGDHEFGKLSFFGGLGGMRLASYHCTRKELALERFWQVELGRYVLMGMTSSLAALPVYEPETLPEERAEWQRLRGEHLAEIRAAFSALKPEQRVLLFCHDPTALPFLWHEEVVRSRLSQVEHTVIGHLHSNVIYWKSRVLAGMPPIRFLGNAARRMSTALNEARLWKFFRVRLCPSLAGIELLKDGGFLTVTLEPDGDGPARFQWHRLRR